VGVRVMGEVFELSRAEHAARLVLLAIADNGSQVDGVAWPSQPEIMRKTLLGERTVRDAIDELVELGELEVRLGQAGRVRQNVYRITVGKYAATEVDYRNIPFALREPFSRPADSAGRHEGGSAGGSGSGLVENLWKRPAKSAGRKSGDDRQKTALTTGEIRRRHIRKEPSVEPSAAADALAASLSDAAAAGLEHELQALRAGRQLRELALADPDRAMAWIQVAKIEAAKPAGFVRAGLESGEWPSDRGDAFSTADRTREWITAVSWRFDSADAHLLLDERCSKLTIDKAELAELHELVDAEHDRRAEGRAAA
jgi:hypothetical protein